MQLASRPVRAAVPCIVSAGFIDFLGGFVMGSGLRMSPVVHCWHVLPVHLAQCNLLSIVPGVSSISRSCMWLKVGSQVSHCILLEGIEPPSVFPV